MMDASDQPAQPDEPDSPATPQRPTGRRLAAIVFADVAGYTDLSSRDEDLALRIIVAFQRVSRQVVGAHDGRVVKFLGDGMLAEFRSLDSAVAASHALQAAFGTMKENVDAKVSLRVGVHLGDVVFGDDGDVYGSGVNVASRIESHAPLSGIVVSDSAYRHLRNRKAYRFSSIGEHVLKGVPDPMELYVVLLEGDQPAAPAVKVVAQEIPPPQHPAWAFARWAFAVVLVVAAAAYAANVPGVRSTTVRFASTLGLGPVVGRTSVHPPTYASVEGGAVVDGALTLRFTGPINPSTATSSSIHLYGPDDEPVPVRVTVEAGATQVQISPERPLLYESEYRIIISSLLRSAAGTAIDLPEGDAPLEQRLAFMTQPPPAGAPRLVGTVPAEGAGDVARDAAFTFTFDQAMDASTVDETTVMVTDGQGRTVPVGVDCCGEQEDLLRVRPTRPLEPGRYSVRLGGGLADRDGEYLSEWTLAFEVSDAAPQPAVPEPSGPGRLAINVVPASLAPRTLVYLDGTSLGPPPIQGRSLAESIRHRIEIFATSELSAGRLSIYDDEIILGPGEQRTLNARVVPFGSVSIHSEPAGIVLIDGQEIGPTPLVAHPVAADRPHTLEIRPAASATATHGIYSVEFTVSVLESLGLGRIQLPERNETR